MKNIDARLIILVFWLDVLLGFSWGGGIFFSFLFLFLLGFPCELIFCKKTARFATLFAERSADL